MVEFRQGDPEKQDKRRADMLGRALGLRDMVDARESTVASWMLVNSKAGSVTISSFDEDEGFSEHTAPFDAVTILDGECDVWKTDETFQMATGQTIFPANVPRALSAVTRFKISLTMLRG